MYSHILVPTDGSTVSARAEKAAIALARKFKARITAIYVVAPATAHVLGEIRGAGIAPLSSEEYRLAAEKRGNAALKRVVARARLARVKCEAVLATGKPATALVEAAAKRRCDLIVMGSSSRTGLDRVFLGSVAAAVLKDVRKPTLICH